MQSNIFERALAELDREREREMIRGYSTKLHTYGLGGRQKASRDRLQALREEWQAMEMERLRDEARRLGVAI